jgi:FAD/FMN-containing dehydrogenase
LNKVAHYLQQHLVGEVLTSPDVVNYFSTDESIFSIKPLLVVHPRNENDLRKAARFSWQLAERGRVIPLTMRGKGTDQTGAALGYGIILSTPAHMNKIIELDPKSGVVTVQSGLSVAKLQQTLHTHGRFLPSTTSASEYTTIGGAVANNDAGPTSYKFGPMREHVIGMRVVLANGELIRTTRLSKRELNKKLGLASFEGQIYRELDKLIEESSDTIESLRALGDRNNIGYAIGDVKLKDGSFDITPLLVGSQSTLGLISEVTLDTAIHNPAQEMIVGLCSDTAQAAAAVSKINELKDSPSTLDFIDESVIDHVRAVNPGILKSTIGSDAPKQVLFITSDLTAGKFSKRTRKQIKKIIEQHGCVCVEPTSQEAENWQVVLESVSFSINHSEGRAKNVPLINDVVVPVEKMSEFIQKAKEIVAQHTNKPAVFWGQAGSGIVHDAVMYDVGQVGDRQRMFKLLDSYCALASSLGGSVSGESAEGRLRGSQVQKVLQPEAVALMKRIKQIFDPFSMLNPNVKVGVETEILKGMVRDAYTENRHMSFLPRG